MNVVAKGIAVSLLLALPASLRATADAPSADWLVGTWLLIEGDVAFPDACDSGLPITYKPDGTYILFEESGTWRLEGGKLTEVATESVLDEDEAMIGRPFVSSIARQGQDAMLKTFADGVSHTLRRCPDSVAL